MPFNIQCAPGALGMQDCDLVLADGTRQKIWKYDASGNPITQAPSTSPGTAWVPQLWSLNQAGDQYAPFGAGGIPYTMSGMVNWQGKGANFNQMGAADPQSQEYLNTITTAQDAYNTRLCNPLWPTMGCRTIDWSGSSGTVTTAPEESWWNKFWGAEGDNMGIIPNKMIAPTAVVFGALGLGYVLMKNSSN
jgi:hypothetical protein